VLRFCIRVYVSRHSAKTDTTQPKWGGGTCTLLVRKTYESHRLDSFKIISCIPGAVHMTSWNKPLMQRVWGLHITNPKMQFASLFPFSYCGPCRSHPQVKVKWSRYRPGVAQRVGRRIALLFHDRSTRRGWVVCSTPRPHFTPGKDPVPILQEVGWAPGPVWTDGKSLPHRDSIPDPPARRKSLHRLSYLAHSHPQVWSLMCIPKKTAQHRDSLKGNGVQFPTGATFLFF